MCRSQLGGLVAGVVAHALYLSIYQHMGDRGRKIPVQDQPGPQIKKVSASMVTQSRNWGTHMPSGHHAGFVLQTGECGGAICQARLQPDQVVAVRCQVELVPPITVCNDSTQGIEQRRWESQ